MSSLQLHNIDLPVAQMRAIAKKAKHAGKTPTEYVRWLIERDLLADQTFDEILSPVRKDFRRSGVSESELETIIDRARRSRSSGRARS